MLYFNNSRCDLYSINIFGKGELFKQIEPLLKLDNIIIDNIFDDTVKEERYQINSQISRREQTASILYCVGYKDMKRRYGRFVQIKDMGFPFATFIANNAIFSSESSIENGSLINQGAIIDNYAAIGECVFINIGSTISHHTVIKNNVFIAPGVSIAGHVTVDEGAFIGTNATVIDHIHVGEYSIVAAGAVVIHDVPPYTMVAGNPAQVKKSLL